MKLDTSRRARRADIGGGGGGWRCAAESLRGEERGDCTETRRSAEGALKKGLRGRRDPKVETAGVRSLSYYNLPNTRTARPLARGRRRPVFHAQARDHEPNEPAPHA